MKLVHELKQEVGFRGEGVRIGLDGTCHCRYVENFFTITIVQIV